MAFGFTSEPLLPVLDLARRVEGALSDGPVNSEALWCCGDWADSEFLPDDGGEEFDWLAATAAAAVLSR